MYIYIYICIYMCIYIHIHRALASELGGRFRQWGLGRKNCAFADIIYIYIYIYIM